MVEEWWNVRTIEECEEEATVDCYNEDECLSGWFTCLEEILTGVEKVKIFGEEVQFKGIDFSGKGIVAVCQKGREKIKVALESIEFKELSRIQKLWLKAWLELGRSSC